jgi:hypothetical protein
MKKIFLPLILLGISTSVYAEKVRVFYRPNGKVSVLYIVNKACKKTETSQQCFKRIVEKDCPKDAQGKCYPYKDMDSSQLPGREYRGKWRNDGANNIKVDHTIVLKSEELALLNSQLDDELAKPEPNPVEVIRIKREIDKKGQIRVGNEIN